jgi:hypothetical protein
LDAISSQGEQPQRIPPWWTDPTENVKVLVEASDRRQDDLRQMSVGNLRREMELRAEYEAKLRAQESARIDAIRAVDVGAVQEASRVAAAQAGALAAQLAATAEASRAQVQAAATAAVTSLAAALEPIQKDIRDLRDSQSRGVGIKEQVVESRDVRGENRLNLGAIVGVAVLTVAVISLILLYATKK